MSILSFLIIIVSLLFVIIGYDLYKRQRINIIHYIIFLGGGGIITYLSFNLNALDKFGQFFGIARGADLIVYIGLILLFLFYFVLLNRFTTQHILNTKLARYLCIQQAQGNIKKADTVFVIPCYNESDIVIKTIQSVINAGYAVIMVDDGSSSKEIYNKAQKLIAEKKDTFVLLRHPYNLGQGAALQTGATYITEKLAETKYIVHFDADGQHRIEDIKQFQEAFKKNKRLDIVIGSRFMGTESNMSKTRRRHKKAQILFSRLVVGLKLTDTHNGYRMIKSSALSKLEITLNGMAHASEIEALIKKNQLNYQEVPIKVIYSEYSRNKGQSLGIGNAFSIAKNLLYRMLFYR